MIEEEFPITINFDKVSKDKTFLPFVRLLALDLMENPYMSVGPFLQSITDSDLKEILDLIDTDEDAALGSILLTTEMLAQAEGMVSESLEELTERSNTMLTYLVIESLKRKGLVNVFYENMSFGEDYADKLIVERIHE